MNSVKQQICRYKPQDNVSLVPAVLYFLLRLTLTSQQRASRQSVFILPAELRVRLYESFSTYND